MCEPHITGASELSRPSRCRDHVADRVDADVETEIFHPRHDEVAAGPVFVGEGEARAAAAVDGADLAEGGKPPEQAVAVDAHPLHHPGAFTICQARRREVTPYDPPCGQR